MYRSGSLDLIPRAKNVCSIEGCTGEYQGKGFCTKHYSRIRRTGETELLPPLYTSNICSVAGCNRKRDSLGYCSLHYLRFKTHGETGAVGKITQRGMELKERLLKRRKINESTGCWEWIGGTRGNKKHRYGVLSIGGKNKAAHRLSAHEFLGFDLNSKMLICHHCDNPCCINPCHLFVGTVSDNAIDMLQKGRGNKLFGIDHGNCKYTNDQIIESKKLREKGMTYRAIQKETGVYWRTVQEVCCGRQWTHLN